MFVSLHNGAMVVYTRDKQGSWDMENYQIIVVDTSGLLLLNCSVFVSTIHHGKWFLGVQFLCFRLIFES